MKNIIKYLFQKGLGFDNYLYLFSKHCIRKVSRGSYEREFRHFISLLPDSGLILDIGANIGITAVSIGIKCPGTEIHAYEPIEENFQTLLRVIKSYKLKNILAYNTALGDKSGQLKMVMPLNGKTRLQGMSKMYDPNHPVKGKLYIVNVRTLDEIYKGLKVSAIKMDVENFEYEVFLGAQQILNENKPLIYCELWNNSKRMKVIELMLSINYSVYVYNEKANSLVPFKKPYITNDTNFFFISHIK